MHTKKVETVGYLYKKNSSDIELSQFNSSSLDKLPEVFWPGLNYEPLTIFLKDILNISELK